MENDLKHEGYVWVVRRDQPCPTGANCTTDFRVQVHAIMGAHDMPVRYHSYSFEGRVCGNPNNSSTCGIVRVGGWIDMGRLLTTAPNLIACNHGIEEIFIPLPADNLYRPIERPEARDEIRCHPNIVTLPPQPSIRSLAEWWGHAGGDRFRVQLKSYDPIGNVDPVDPSRWQFFCTPEDVNCRYDGSVFSAFIGYVLKVSGGFDTRGDFVNLDPDGNNVANYQAYMTRWGIVNPTCSAAGLDCVPLEYSNVVLNWPQYREAAYNHSPCDNCAHIDMDISPPGQKWITWFYRYRNMGTGTPTAVPSQPPTGTAMPTSPSTSAPTLSPTPSPVPTGPAVVVGVNPASTNPGMHVTVMLQLVNVSDVYGLQSECTVDPTVLVGDTVAGAEGFNNDNSFFVNSQFKPDTGAWMVAASRLHPNPAISGNANAYSLLYIAQTTGTTAVNCTVLAVNSNGQQIALQVINGTYGNGGTPPQPTAATQMPTMPPTATPIPTTVPTLEAPTETPEVGAMGAITGAVHYQNAPDNAGIRVQLLSNDTPLNEITTGADGTFAFNDVVAGIYAVKFIAPQHLAATISVTLDGSGQSIDLGVVSLIAGDTDDDGDVDVLDATFVGANFDVDVPPAPNNADMNHDALVNISDLVLVGSNFGETSPVPME
jgi:hypothetical protein